MSDFLTSQLPATYRLDLSEKLATCIKQGKSLNLIGMPAVGKNIYIQSFLNNYPRFSEGKNNVDFRIINLREFGGKSFNSFKNFLTENLGKLLKEKSQEKEIYVILRFIEEIDKKLIPDITKYFLAIRQLPYKVRFIFLSNRPLKELTSDRAASSRLFGLEEYFRPTSQEDFDHEIRAYEDYLKIDFTPEGKRKIYELTGGHGGYLKLVMSYEKEMRLKFFESDLYSRVVEKNDLPSDFQNRSKEILRVFNNQELSTLTKIAKDNYRKNILSKFFKRSAEIPQFLLNLGIVIKDNGQTKIFSKLLEVYLKSH